MIINERIVFGPDRGGQIEENVQKNTDTCSESHHDTKEEGDAHKQDTEHKQPFHQAGMSHVLEDFLEGSLGRVVQETSCRRAAVDPGAATHDRYYVRLDVPTRRKSQAKRLIEKGPQERPSEYQSEKAPHVFYLHKKAITISPLHSTTTGCGLGENRTRVSAMRMQRITTILQARIKEVLARGKNTVLYLHQLANN
jgi:hypothetical protein